MLAGLGYVVRELHLEQIVHVGAEGLLDAQGHLRVLSTGEDGWTKGERGIQQVDFCPWRWLPDTGHKEGTHLGT